MLEKTIQTPPATLSGTRLYLDRLWQSAHCLETDVNTMDKNSETPLGWWSHAFAGQCRNALDELTLLAPWIDHFYSLDKPHDMADFDIISTLNQVARMDAEILPEIDHRLSLDVKDKEKLWLNEFARLITVSGQRARKRIADIEILCRQANEFAQMNYDFLFDVSRRLLSIGYNVSEHRRDSGYYDLLASEARFAVFVAIAQGQLPQESWFSLGRLLTTTGEGPILLSWSGSMFEYLMPLLVMPTYENTLLYRPVGQPWQAKLLWQKNSRAMGYFRMWLQCH